MVEFNDPMKIANGTFNLAIVVFVLHYVNYTVLQAGILVMILPQPEGIVTSKYFIPEIFYT